MVVHYCVFMLVVTF